MEEITRGRVLWYATIFFLGMILLTSVHEKVHVIINGHYDLTSKVYWFKYFPSVATEANAPCPTDTCRLAHEINEAITYPLQTIYFVVVMYLLTKWSFILEDQKKRKEHGFLER